ncbi:hypothetical protein GG344DRAFT_72679 [Lentinula edodes]|nr:hypothetical protein GG344DRAFT_72679 [Lentinula edodes]
MLSTPWYWTKISVRCTSTRGILPEFHLLQLFLERSKENLLDLNVSFPISGYHTQELILQLFKTLAAQAHRWNSLEIFATQSQHLCLLRHPYISSCPELTSLTLKGVLDSQEGPAMNFVPMPKLKSFIPRVFNRPLRPDSSFPWHQLTKLSLDCWSLSDLSFVGLCKNLLHLRISVDYDSEMTPPRVPKAPVPSVLEQLRTLTLVLSPSEPNTRFVEIVLDLVAMPALAHLEVEGDTSEQADHGAADWPFGIMDALIERDLFPLTTLAIHNISISENDLTTFLRKTPSLTTLSIQEAQFEGSFEKQISSPISINFMRSLCAVSGEEHSSTEAQLLLPNLTTLYLTIYKEFSDGAFTDMIHSRWGDEDHSLTQESSISRLKEVVVHLVDQDICLSKSDSDSTKLKALSALQCQGLFIDVVDSGDCVYLD